MGVLLLSRAAKLNAARSVVSRSFMEYHWLLSDRILGPGQLPSQSGLHGGHPALE